MINLVKNKPCVFKHQSFNQHPTASEHWQSFKKRFMAQWHLDDIESSLNRISWTVTKQYDPNEKESFLGAWLIKRGSERIIDFNGIFDGDGYVINNPSLEKAYGCQVRETNISLYFYKKGEKWNENLEKFIKEINKLK